jgi:hypothetical protein
MSIIAATLSVSGGSHRETLEKCPSACEVSRPLHWERSARLLAELTLRLFYEARLDEMLIEGKGPPDVQLLHDNERDTVREGIILVLMALEIRPALVK